MPKVEVQNRSSPDYIFIVADIINLTDKVKLLYVAILGLAKLFEGGGDLCCSICS